ncbi:MAG: hypothetical protein ABSB71_12675 [Candidatus Bathyarchaeia archaeon]
MTEWWGINEKRKNRLLRQKLNEALPKLCPECRKVIEAILNS